MSQKKEPDESQLGSVSAAEFLRGVRAESKKVTWPAWKETQSATLVVIVFVAISSVFLGGVDFIFSKLVEWLVR